MDHRGQRRICRIGREVLDLVTAQHLNKCSSIGMSMYILIHHVPSPCWKVKSSQFQVEIPYSALTNDYVCHIRFLSYDSIDWRFLRPLLGIFSEYCVYWCAVHWCPKCTVSTIQSASEQQEHFHSAVIHRTIYTTIIGRQYNTGLWHGQNYFTFYI